MNSFSKAIFGLLVAAAAFMPAAALAQATANATIVSSCGTPGRTLPVGKPGSITMDTTGVLCTSASGGGGGGLSVVDGAAFTAGVSNFTPGGGTYNSSIPALSDGTQGTFALTANRSLHVLDDNSAAMLAALTGSIPAGTNLIGKVGIDQTTPGTTNAVSLGYVGSAAALAGNGVTGTGSPRVTIASDNTSIPVNVRQLNQVQSQTASGSSALNTTIVPSQGGSNRFYMTDWVCSNSGATATLVYFLNGSGGLPIAAPAMVPAGGGNNKSFQTAPSTSAATALFISTSAATTSIYCSVTGYSGT